MPDKSNWQVHSIGWFVVAVLAAVLTPTTDALTFAIAFLAGGLLFEASYFAFRWWRRRQDG